MISLIQTSPIKITTTKNKVDTDVNNDDNSKSFVTPRRHNNSDTELSDKNIKTTKDKFKVNTRLYQHSPLNPATSLKLLSSVTDYIYFKLMIELPRPPNVTSQES